MGGGKTKLSLEEYRSFFSGQGRSRLSCLQLSQILQMHGFAKIYDARKGFIMKFIEAIDLMEPCRSTLLQPISPSSAMTVDEVVADMRQIGWADCCPNSTLKHESVLSDLADVGDFGPTPCVPAHPGSTKNKHRRRRSKVLSSPPANYEISGQRPRSKRKIASINTLIATTCVNDTGGLLSEATAIPSPPPSPPCCPPPSPPPLPSFSPPPTPHLQSSPPPTVPPT